MTFGSGISGKPLAQLLFRSVGLAQSIRDAAAEQVIVCAGEESRVAPAFHLDGQLDRVTAVADHSSFKLETMRMAGGLKKHGPTIAYRIDHSLFSSGRLYTNRMQDNQGGMQRRKLTFKVKDKLDTAVLPLSHFATIYFGHMIFDGGATALMAPRFGESYVDTHVSASMAGHIERYWDLFGLSYKTVRDVRIDHAWIFEDRGMNSNKVARLNKMRAQVRQLAGVRTGHGVFIRRRGWGVHRAPENEADLEDYFAARNFEIIDPKQMSVDEIVAQSRNANVVIGVEGSGMTHGMLAMAPGTAVIMLFPPWRLNNMMKDYADGLGMRYGFVVGKGAQNSYQIDPEEIMQTIDITK